MVENYGEFNMLSTTISEDGITGKLKCGYWPVNSDGSEDLPDEMLVNDETELLGKNIFFRVDIEEARGLPINTCRDVYVEYIFKHEPKMKYATPIFAGTS